MEVTNFTTGFAGSLASADTSQLVTPGWMTRIKKSPMNGCRGMLARLSYLVINFECGIGYSFIYLTDNWMSSVILTSHMNDTSTKPEKFGRGVQIRSRNMSWRTTSGCFTRARLGPRSLIITQASEGNSLPISTIILNHPQGLACGRDWR